jgi:hypothetical protein
MGNQESQCSLRLLHSAMNLLFKQPPSSHSFNAVSGLWVAHEVAKDFAYNIGPCIGV